MNGNSGPKYEEEQEVIHKDTGIIVTVVEVVETHNGPYYDIVGWEGTSWGHASEDDLEEFDHD